MMWGVGVGVSIDQTVSCCTLGRCNQRCPEDVCAGTCLASAIKPEFTIRLFNVFNVAIEKKNSCNQLNTETDYQTKWAVASLAMSICWSSTSTF